MIKLTQGDILYADAEALVNTVNCVGVMGRGIALQFKKVFPENFKRYKAACDNKELLPGKMFVYDLNGVCNPRYVINFPTKRHWKGSSRMEDIESGLLALVAEVRKRNIHSIAIPPLGCGLGGLLWNDVRARIEDAFQYLSDVHINRMIAQCGYRADVQPVFVFRNILFDVTSAAIKAESTAQIQEIGAALKEVPTARVVVSGHTDKQCFRGVSQEESDRRNIQLSRERADSVAMELARMSISADRLKTAGYGPTKPEEPGDNPETYAKNRRVTIEVLE